MSGPSEGLLQHLRDLREDGTPRGLVWMIMADLLLGIAPFAVTDEEVELTNENPRRDDRQCR